MAAGTTVQICLQEVCARESGSMQSGTRQQMRCRTLSICARHISRVYRCLTHNRGRGAMLGGCFPAFKVGPNPMSSRQITWPTHRVRQPLSRAGASAAGAEWRVAKGAGDWGSFARCCSAVTAIPPCKQERQNITASIRQYTPSHCRNHDGGYLEHATANPFLLLVGPNSIADQQVKGCRKISANYTALH